MQEKSRAPFRTLVTAAVLALSVVALACSRAAEPATTAPAAAPPPAPPAEPTVAPAEQAQPEAPAAAPAPAPASNAPRDLLDEDREDREDRKAPVSKPKSSAGEGLATDDLESAQAELERARITLNRALASGSSRSAAAPAPSTAGGASRGAGASAPAKAEKKSEESSCTTACNAFSSLERAASAVCRITGEKDGRCGHAHAVVADARKRVAVCSCVAG